MLHFGGLSGEKRSEKKQTSRVEGTGSYYKAKEVTLEMKRCGRERQAVVTSS